MGDTIIYFHGHLYGFFFPINSLLAATHTNQSCVEAIELMYSAAGSTGIYLKNKLAHYLTDAQVLRQHGFMNESRYETAGKYTLVFHPICQ